METLSTREMISVLIRKVQNDWERANGKGAGLSRIDKDILIDDLKKVYELVYELDIIKPSGPAAENFVFSENPVSEDVVIDQIEEKQDVTEISESIGPGKLEMEEKDVEEIIFDEKENPVQQPVIEAKQEVEQDDRPNHKRDSEEVHHQESFPHETIPESQAQSKVTLDLFSASKTLADVYQNDTDNSLAAKIQQNKISDIRTVIGINDKFLFINEIFKGEMSAYNKAIEKLNQTEEYHEALHIIDELKLTNSTDENKTSFSKLVEIAKRRFH